jgi:homoserine/homoserine lactone efflux protein
MSVESWLAFTTMELVLCLTPGPAVLLVLSHATAFGARASLGSTLGILSGNSVYFCLSAAGLGAALLASAGLFEAIRWAGAGYLVLLGIRMLRRGATSPVHDRRAARRGRLSLFAQGFLLQIANPKALVFFTALLPQFVAPSRDLVWQVAVLAVTSVLIELGVLVAYAVAAERGGRLLPPRFWHLQGRLAGGLLFAAGVGVGAVRHP